MRCHRHRHRHALRRALGGELRTRFGGDPDGRLPAVLVPALCANTLSTSVPDACMAPPLALAARRPVCAAPGQPGIASSRARAIKAASMAPSAASWPSSSTRSSTTSNTAFSVVSSRAAMDQHRIVLVNLPKGDLGSSDCRLIGMLQDAAAVEAGIAPCFSAEQLARMPDRFALARAVAPGLHCPLSSRRCAPACRRQRPRWHAANGGLMKRCCGPLRWGVRRSCRIRRGKGAGG